jgi:hypothetical protein
MGRHTDCLMALRGASLVCLLSLAIGSACTPDAPQGGLPTHPSDRFSVSLEWDAPDVDEMGRPLTDLAGYRLYFSLTSPPDGPDGNRIEVGTDTRFTVTGLAAGEYYFGVTALDAAGNESGLSELLMFEVGR